MLRTYYPRWFLLPATLVFTLFFITPAVLGLWLSLTDATVLTQKVNFVGLAQYQLLFGEEREKFLQALTNNLLFAVLDTIAKTGLGVALAFLLNRAWRGRTVVRAIVYLPIMFSTIVIGILFTYILHSDGLVNTALTKIGLGVLAKDWLGDFGLALYSVVGIDTWMGVGWTVVLVLAALQAIPNDVIEAARLDGAEGWQLTFRIKMPFIAHAVNLALLLTFISGMKVFDIVFASTGGGPGNSTEVLATYLQKSMSSGSLGFPAAVSVVQFVLITILAFIINRIARRTEARA